MKGKSTRIGTYKCYQCRKPFTVKVGTVFESSHVPLRHWLQAMFLLCVQQEGHERQSAQPHLGLYSENRHGSSAHRIREAMQVVGVEPMGGIGKIVEADETYYRSIDKDRDHATDRRQESWQETWIRRRPIVSPCAVSAAGRRVLSMS